MTSETVRRRLPVSAIVAGSSDSPDTASFNLMDFANEILVHLFSFLPFKERQVTRRVCRRLLKFVDKSTPGARELRIRLFAVRSTGSVEILPYGEDLESVLVEIDISFLGGRRRQPLEQDELAKLLSSLPTLSSIRPKTVSIYIPQSIFATRELVAGVMQHLTDQQVLDRRQNLICPIAVFRISCCQLLKMPTHFYRWQLASLDWSLLNSIIPPCLKSELCGCLQPWSHCRATPTLRQPIIDHQFRIAYEVNLMNTLAALTNIKKLDFWCSCSVEEVRRAEHFNGFGNMLQGLENLEYLGVLHCPSVHFWQYLMENKVTSISLRELTIGFDRLSPTDLVERLEELVPGLHAVAPALSTLHLRQLELEESSIGALSGLRRHPTLNKVILAHHRAKDQLSTLRELLGSKIKVA